MRFSWGFLVLPSEYHSNTLKYVTIPLLLLSQHFFFFFFFYLDGLGCLA
jgi:hypothetical protein